MYFYVLCKLQRIFDVIRVMYIIHGRCELAVHTLLALLLLDFLDWPNGNHAKMEGVFYNGC